ncbi:hypothetical protein D3C84_1051410 [compost metagenome]
MVVLAALRARLKGWKPSGEYTLGSLGLITNIGALVYGVAAMVNISWPRTPDALWYDNWIVVLSSFAVIAVGFLYMWIARPHLRSAAIYGDAIPANGAVVNGGVRRTTA